MASVLKTEGGKTSVGSNPTPSSKNLENYMCFLCTKELVVLGTKQPDKRKERARIIKRLLNEIELRSSIEKTCTSGNDLYNSLREEQYQLAREL